MIGHLDDVAKLKKTFYKAHTKYDFLITTRLPWGKNVRETRQSPWQVVVVEDNWELDNHLLMAKFLEMACERPGLVRTQSLFVEQGDTPKNLKSHCRHHLKKEILQTPRFKAIYPLTGRSLHQDDDNYQAKMGAHSNCKLARQGLSNAGIVQKRRQTGVGGGRT